MVVLWLWLWLCFCFVISCLWCKKCGDGDRSTHLVVNVIDKKRRRKHV